MPSDELATAIATHLEAVAAHLQGELAAGAEVQFELEQHGRRRGSGRPALYCYRPLTAEFITAREGALEALPSHRQAAFALADFAGLERYLLGAGVDLGPAAGAGRVRAALAALMDEVFAEQSSFELRPERLEAALERLRSSAGSDARELTLLATLHGLALGGEELAVTSGLRILRPDTVTGLPPAALAGRAQESGGAEHLLVMLSENDEEPERALARGRGILADLLRALRLFGDGRITLGRLAWVRVGDGAWHSCPLGEGGRPQGILLVTAEQEDELRAFCNLVSRRAPDGGPLAWALRRFELGCERASELEGLSDHLLALRALLEPRPGDEGALPRRLAALCATEEQREALQARAAAAVALERSIRLGEGSEGAGEQELAGEIADHLRALLRDVICGHLQGELAGVADELAVTREPPAGPDPDQDGAPPAQPLEVASGASPSSLEEIFSDPRQAEEILDVLI